MSLTMKYFNLKNIMRILLIVLCCLVFLTACSDDEGGTPIRTAEQGGETPEMVADSQRQCWQEGLLRSFYSNIGAQTSNVYKALTSENVYATMMLIFSIWMAFQILRHVSTTTPESLGEFWTKILQKGFLCIVCGMLASSTDQIVYAINNFVFPIFVTLLEFASNIMDILSKANPDSSLSGVQIIPESGEKKDIICEVYSHFMSSCKISNAAGVKFDVAGGMPQGPLDLMACMACSVSDRLSIGYILAYKLFTMATILSVLVGIIIIVTFTIAKFSFVLYLVDSIFRLNMMMIVMPFLILFFPFSQTRKWTVTGFKFIINSSAILLCLALLVSMSIVAMEEILLDHRLGFNFAEPKEYYNFGVVPMAMIFLGFLMVKISGMAVELAGKVVGGGGDTKFQKAIAAIVGTAASYALQFFTAGASKVMKVIETGMGPAGKLSAKARNNTMGSANKMMNDMIGNNQGNQQ